MDECLAIYRLVPLEAVHPYPAHRYFRFHGDSLLYPAHYIGDVRLLSPRLIA
jgi:hypothetical protein